MKRFLFSMFLVFVLLVPLAHAENWHDAYMSEEVSISVKITEHNEDFSGLKTVSERYVGYLTFDYQHALFYFHPSDPEMNWLAGSNVMLIQTWSGTKKDKLILMGSVAYEGGYLYVDVTGKLNNSFGFVKSIDVSGSIVAVSRDAYTKLSFINVKLHPAMPTTNN